MLVPPESGPGEVEAALEATLAALEGPDPAVAASARRLARALDTAEVPNPAVSAELRRHVAQLQADARRIAAEKAKPPSKRSQSWLDDMRAAREESPIDRLRRARAEGNAKRLRGRR